MKNHSTARRKSPNLWIAVTQRYGTVCAYCHDNYATQIDHVIPVSWRSSNRIENLRPCCQWCNLAMSDRVFETFEDKHDWLLGQRRTKNIGKHKRTVCIQCLLPFQNPFHCPSFFFCPECYDIEFGTITRKHRQWQQFLELCDVAGFCIPAHTELRNWVLSFGGMAIEKEIKAAKLADFRTAYEGWELAEEDEVYVAS